MQEKTTAALAKALAAEQLPFVQQEVLAGHTTFKIGGPAAFWCAPRNAAELRRILQHCRAQGVRVYLLGNGSNTLFDDAGFDGAVVDMRGLNEMKASDADTDLVRITAGAGQTLGRLCSKAQTLGLTGLEFACGIPGTVGGAVYMNAGAYGGEMKDVLEAVSYLTADGRWVDSEASELDFSYRHSAFEENGACILGAVFHLEKGDPDTIKARMNELMQKRIDKQPLDKPSAGSTFKRPAGAFAAALIDQCGLRGYRHGGAAVSDKHCGFVVNLGGATCADVLALCDEVRAIVKEKTGYDLEKEIRVVK